jgi:uncharacterized protein (TIGR02145 family)
MKKILNSVILAAFLAACTDYVAQIDEREGEWETSSVASSSSVTPQSSSSETSESSSSVTITDGSEYDADNNTLKDLRDSTVYKTVTIGSQTWMAENLNYETANSYCYNDSTEYCTKYGRLYIWAAAMDSVGTWSTNGKGCGYNKTCSPTYPVRGICPEGWHLPTKAEFETLFTAVGGQSTAGKVLKSTSGWNSSGNGTDAYAFSALPAGNRYSGEGDYAYFWSSTEYASDIAYYMGLGYGGRAELGHSYKYDGWYSVRCLKDDESEQTEESSSSSYVAECTPVSAHKVTLSNALQSSQSAINFETGLSDNPHITIKFANDAATIIPGDGVTVYEDNSQTTGLEAEVQPGNTSVCREDFRKSTIQFNDELISGLWLDIVDASGNIYPMMVKKAMFESSTKGMVDIVYYN